MNETMTASAFAKLCNTTKATLRWYRKIGILEPVQVGSNGYAYYTVDQMIEFRIIQTLQSIGYSLEQIKAYNNGGLAETASFYDEQISLLDQRITELKEKRNFLKHLQSVQSELTDKWGEYPKDGDWHIRFCQKESYLVMNAPINDTSVYLQRLANFQQLCQQIGLGTNAPIAMFFNEKTLAKREFAEGYCIATKISDPTAIKEKLAHLDAGNTEMPYLISREAGNYFAYLTTLPLAEDATTTTDVVPFSNPMINGQNAALDLALREGATLEMGLLESPLAAPPQKDGGQRLFLELLFAAF